MIMEVHHEHCTMKVALMRTVVNLCHGSPSCHCICPPCTSAIAFVLGWISALLDKLDQPYTKSTNPVESSRHRHLLVDVSFP